MPNCGWSWAIRWKKTRTIDADFMDGAFDVLVSNVTIVESGLDVPNANTIFINKAIILP